jgi:hypothetical protein
MSSLSKTFQELSCALVCVITQVKKIPLFLSLFHHKDKYEYSNDLGKNNNMYRHVSHLGEHVVA